MIRLDIKSIFYKQCSWANKYPYWLLRPFIYLLKKFFCEEVINDCLRKNDGLRGFEFVKGVVDYFKITYKVNEDEVLNIPKTGRVIIIANHPLGALDALSLILLVKQVRQDVKIVANDLLMYLSPLHDLLIPVDAMNARTAKQNIKQIYNALHEEKAVIIFPSGEVSRVRPTGVRDTAWNKGFINFAKKTNSPILPVFIRAKNSNLFYIISMINKNLATYFLPREMVKKKNGTVKFKIGQIIAYKSLFGNALINQNQLSVLVQKHLYKIGKNKQGVFKTQTHIAKAQDKQKILEELKLAKILGKTKDEKTIYLFEYFENSVMIEEIGRLRELTFRKVEEGTGKSSDLDGFDKYYKHIILWDENEEEIVGAYRLGEANFILQAKGFGGFYSNHLFEYLEDFKPYLKNSIELGRSFVQPKYWGSKALEYLWFGIGAYLYQNPHIRYIFGPVTLSGAYPKIAQNMIISFYQNYFSPPKELVKAKEPFIMNAQELEDINMICESKNYKDDFRCLKSKLPLGVGVPTLYKQYAELFDEDGIYFAAFNIDKDFENCVDSFVIADISKMKEAKKKRYIKQSIS